MGNRLTTLTGGFADNELATAVRESAHQVWLAGLGAYAITLEEGGKAFNSLVSEGEVVNARARKIADQKIAEIASKAAGTLDQLEHVLDDGVARFLARLGVPSKKDINKLSNDVVALSAVVHELVEKKMAEKHDGKPVALPAASADEPDRKAPAHS